MRQAVTDLSAVVGIRAACDALGVARAGFYRQRITPRRLDGPPRPARQPPARALRADERDAVLAARHTERFRDRAPAAVQATLLDEGTYLCSTRTMYRVLAQAGESHERRDQLVHPAYQKPELLATAPNHLWSWDITKLHGPAKWTYFYLYVILDVFSRYVVGWMIAHREGAEWAEAFVAETIVKHDIPPGQLTLDHMECPPLTGAGLCSDDECPCRGTAIPPARGYLYISQRVVDMRRDCLTRAEAEAKYAGAERTLHARQSRRCEARQERTPQEALHSLLLV